MTVKSVDIYTGQAAHDLLKDNRFLAAWRKLYASCSYATGFQSPGFVSAWYIAYTKIWEPIIVSSTFLNGDLRGLWLLAYNRETKAFTHAGAHQAEYHVWLALPNEEISFLAIAWHKLRQVLTFERLLFKYLPKTSLIDTLSAIPEIKDCFSADLHSRPLMVLDSVDIKASIAKKSNKSRLNRLKKLGAIEFERINNLTEFEQVFDDIIAYYDLRQGAINKVTPFHDDHLKRGFYIALFVAGELEVTVTYLNKRAIAAFWGTVSGNTIHLGILAHSPILAAHSPGKLHLLQLSDYLLKKGVQILDLTPGGDPWKERFANSHDEVLELTMYSSSSARRKENTLRQMVYWSKRGAAIAGIKPSDIRKVLSLLRRATPKKVLLVARKWSFTDREYRLYHGDKSLAHKFHRDVRVACNSLPDLLCFEPSESWQRRDAFLSSALARLENGSSIYTVCIDGRLAHSGWIAYNQSSSYMTEVKQATEFPPASVCLYDFYTHPEFRGKGLYRATIQTMMCDAFADNETQHCFISVLADNLPSRHVIEDLGFQYIRSFFWKQRFGMQSKGAGPAPCSRGI